MDYIDLYCERLAPGLWAEPANALTNISFFIAAIATWHLAKQSLKLTAGIWLLVSLMVAIGIGSTLFHTFATQWASLTDILPIFLFQLCFLWLYSRRVIKLNPGFAGALLTGFTIAASVSRQFPTLLNGSFVYAPAFCVLLGLAIYHYQHQKQEPFVLLAAFGTFAVSLFFRTIDQSICSNLAIGTHFLWHTLNGVLLYLSARGLILNWPRAIKTGASQ